MREKITRIALDHEEILQLHGFYVNPEKKHISFDLVFDFIAEDYQSLVDTVRAQVETAYPGWTCTVNIDVDVSD